MSRDIQVTVMRNMAWQRAKGELKSILETSDYDSYGSQEIKCRHFKNAQNCIEEFIQDFERNYL